MSHPSPDNDGTNPSSHAMASSAPSGLEFGSSGLFGFNAPVFSEQGYEASYSQYPAEYSYQVHGYGQAPALPREYADASGTSSSTAQPGSVPGLEGFGGLAISGYDAASSQFSAGFHDRLLGSDGYAGSDSGTKPAPRSADVSGSPGGDRVAVGGFTASRSASSLGGSNPWGSEPSQASSGSAPSSAPRMYSGVSASSGGTTFSYASAPSSGAPTPVATSHDPSPSLHPHYGAFPQPQGGSPWGPPAAAAAGYSPQYARGSGSGHSSRGGHYSGGGSMDYSAPPPHSQHGGYHRRGHDGYGGGASGSRGMPSGLPPSAYQASGVMMAGTRRGGAGGYGPRDAGLSSPRGYGAHPQPSYGYGMMAPPPTMHGYATAPHGGYSGGYYAPPPVPRMQEEAHGRFGGGHRYDGGHSGERGDRGERRSDRRHGGGSSGGDSSFSMTAPVPSIPFRVEDLVGKVMAMSRDQNGCRLLQQKLDDGHARIHELVFQECLPHLPELMVDPFGNYLFQKMVEHCTPAQRLVILRSVVVDDSSSPPASQLSSPVLETRSLTHTPVMMSSLGSSANTSPLGVPASAGETSSVSLASSEHVPVPLIATPAPPVITTTTAPTSSAASVSSYTGSGSRKPKLNHVVRAALNLHGTRSVQKLVDVCRLPEEVELIVKALYHWVVHLATDPNGNHVIQRCLLHLPVRDRAFVIEAVHAQALVVARHRHGCCVLQRCLDAATEEQRDQLTSEIVEHALLLMQDPFGNYVIQYILQKGTWEQARALMTRIPGHMVSLSTQKFSSNVVEKCIQMADDEMKAMMLTEVCNDDAIVRLLHDQFGNYVIQRALTVSSIEMGTQLVNAIRPHLPALANSSGGRRITARILKRFPDLLMSAGPGYMSSLGVVGPLDDMTLDHMQ